MKLCGMNTRSSFGLFRSCIFLSCKINVATRYGSSVCSLRLHIDRKKPIIGFSLPYRFGVARSQDMRLRGGKLGVTTKILLVGQDTLSVHMNFFSGGRCAIRGLGSYRTLIP